MTVKGMIEFFQVTAQTELVEWLEAEMERRRWQPSDLARAAGIDTGTLSNVLNGRRRAGRKVCLALAKALEVPPEWVLRRAGLLPPLPGNEEDATLGELVDIAKRLDKQERQEALEYLLWRYRTSR
jgi:transcriptional regulator with XRE-family HTH domain